ncbi:MAG: hypothetical protein CSA45_02665 [Gammaproteobacteria bacterium]|nr:MAG: hypothetical protein CSA45_02665 [Gammaproteobacteria bacterium]
MEFVNSIGILDIVFVVILIASVLLGLVRGVFREILSLAGLVIAVYLAFKFSDVLANNYVAKFFEEPRISYLIAFAIIIVLTLFAIALLNLVFNQLLRATGLSTLNRLLGLIFGLLRGTLICSILVLLISFIPGATNESWWKKSSLAPTFQSIAKLSIRYLPKEVSDYFQTTKESIGKVTNTLKPNQLPLKAVRPDQQANEKNTQDDILKSIAESRKETEQPSIELESATDQPEKEQDNSGRTKLTLESSQ